MAQSLNEMLMPLPEGRRPGMREEIPEEIIADARAQGRRIVEQAKVQATAIIEDARVKSELIKADAWEEGRQAGEDAARAEVEQMLTTGAEAFRADVTAELQAIVNSIGEGREKLWEQQEEQMLAFVLDITRQVIKTEVQENPEVLMSILNNAMRRLTDKENIRLRVSTTDVQRMRGAREEVMMIVDGIRNLEIVDDRRIAQGGCVIESNAGTIDAKIETQMAEIERAIEEAD